MKSHRQCEIVKRKRRKLGYAVARVARIRQSAKLCCVALFIGLSFSCTGSPPDIVEVIQTIAFRYDPVFDRSFELLHIYAVVSDPDGLGDVADMYVLNDDQSVFWKLDQDSWDMYEDGEKIWIGSHALRMPQARVIPRGRYRLQVYDRAGELSARTLEVLQSNSIDNSAFTFPSLEYNDNEIQLVSSYADNVVRWYYHPDGSVFEYNGSAGQISVQETAPALAFLWESDAAIILASSSFYIYSFPADDIRDYYILVGPIRIQ